MIGSPTEKSNSAVLAVIVIGTPLPTHTKKQPVLSAAGLTSCPPVFDWSEAEGFKPAAFLGWWLTYLPSIDVRFTPKSRHRLSRHAAKLGQTNNLN